MIFAKTLDDGTIVSGPFDQLWPNRAANDEEQYAQTHGYHLVSAWRATDPIFEKLGPSEVYFDNGRYYEVDVTEAELDIVKSRLQDIVAKERRDQEMAGIPYTFPDGEGTIQTRNDTDIRNVQAQVLAGIILQGQGVTAPVMTFRDAENETHAMTPVQMITMGMTVSATISGFYQAKWEKDDSINNLTSVTEARAWLEEHNGD